MEETEVVREWCESYTSDKQRAWMLKPRMSKTKVQKPWKKQFLWLKDLFCKSQDSKVWGDDLQLENPSLWFHTRLSITYGKHLHQSRHKVKREVDIYIHS